jgi:hypothetical protein
VAFWNDASGRVAADIVFKVRGRLHRPGHPTVEPWSGAKRLLCD